MEKKRKNKPKKKWEWVLTETINPLLSEEEISNIINKKLAYIIVELEHNPVSYIKINNLLENRCQIGKNAL